MWSAFFVVLFFIFIERLSRSSHAPKTQNTSFFWLISNLFILSLLINSFQPQLIRFYNLLSLPSLINLTEYNISIQFILFFICVDFFKFISHWAFHHSHFLWKFHSVHHSSIQLDALASFKHSWGEAFINMFLTTFLMQLFSINMSVAVFISFLFTFICIWQHANIDWTFFKLSFLNYLFITPTAHQIHHELHGGMHRVNLGFVFTIWDRLFGTFSNEKQLGSKYGIDNLNYPYHSNLRQLFYPFFGSNQDKAKLFNKQ